MQRVEACQGKKELAVFLTNNNLVKQPISLLNMKNIQHSFGFQFNIQCKEQS